jgi:hypothetical protein
MFSLLKVGTLIFQRAAAPATQPEEVVKRRNLKVTTREKRKTRLLTLLGFCLAWLMADQKTTQWRCKL